MLKIYFSLDILEIDTNFAATNLCLTLYNLTTMQTGFNYYRIKMQWKAELQDGSLEKIKTEDLVYASSYSEAEQMAYSLIEAQDRTRHDKIYSLEIIKTKISDILYNNTLDHDNELVGGMVYNFFPSVENGEGLYAVKVEIITIDERTAKEKRTLETIYTPATDNHDAGARVLKYMSASDAVVRNVTFDKAESILWPTGIFQTKSNQVA